LDGGQKVGGISGVSVGISINNSYNTGDITSTSGNASTDSSVGGICGLLNNNRCKFENRGVL